MKRIRKKKKKKRKLLVKEKSLMIFYASTLTNISTVIKEKKEIQMESDMK